MDWGEFIPRLQRFYGGRPQDWLEAVPAALVRAFVKMMPRIEAKERLSAMGTAALCHNVAFDSEIDRQREVDELERKVAGAPPPAPVKANPDDLAGMGIGVKIDGDMPVIGDLNAWLGNGAEDHG